MHSVLQLLWTATAAVLPYFAVAETPKKVVSPAAPDRAEEFFKHLDANHDGVITHNEVPADASPMLKALLWDADKKGEGKVTHDEFVATLKEKRSHFGPPPFADQMHHHPGWAGSRRYRRWPVRTASPVLPRVRSGPPWHARSQDAVREDGQEQGRQIESGRIHGGDEGASS